MALSQILQTILPAKPAPKPPANPPPKPPAKPPAKPPVNMQSVTKRKALQPNLFYANKAVKNNIKPVIVCIAKFEHEYIEEFVKYHLALGFHHIFIYDNDDTPTYENLLHAYANSITVIHFPGNSFHKGVQYMALDHFVANHMKRDNITHVAHIDIDEFIVLKRHINISAFIGEFIVGDCAGIGMNWRFFGSSGNQEKTDRPVTERFVMRESSGNRHIKTLFNVQNFVKYNSCHDIMSINGTYIKATNGSIIDGPFNNNFDFSVIQLNHYKCKTLPEFRYIRSRGRSGVSREMQKVEDIDANFHIYNRNECEDLTARDYYRTLQ